MAGVETDPNSHRRGPVRKFVPKSRAVVMGEVLRGGRKRPREAEGTRSWVPDPRDHYGPDEKRALTAGLVRKCRRGREAGDGRA